ncbi:circularly permuted type 2 ATP-grasp protein [Adlercreutzia sp. R21]|uniref:circularly permuted type 2 ATP-grasp protein n=1 Tax=Adlercreutzia wanghongyangiae TaxID=3111451 RepID=UPI002DB9242E|nr:circularly permuted type 2 ATP-grasp protein [Adlercreutzia sp. R21]MEC4183736.1 circularly permuted type 2 ATP-grasp protein [Adlercreutzia sp. R21]
MPTNADYTRDYFQIIDELDGAIEGRRAAFAYMMDSTAIVHHEVVASSFVPRLFNQRTYDVMKHTAETCHGILCKVIERYREDAAYRKNFDFDERLVELICLPRDYDAVLPFARVDTFLNEDDYRIHFCEFNGDGSAGMNENREITNSIKSSEAFRAFAENHRLLGCDLFDPWVRAFMDIYATYRFKVENPRVAICDYLENGVVDEFHIFAERFRAAGVDCAVVDVRDLVFDGEVLRDGDGKPVNAIWRRCVTNDVLQFWDESQALIDAVRARKVALIGSFAGHIVHDKQLFEVLFKPETQAFLTEEEIAFVEATVPMTAFLNEDEVNLAQIRANKDEWIIKPTDHYGADNVYAGCEQSQEVWEQLIDRYANEGAGYPFIVQRYIRPFKTDTLPPDAGILDMPDGAVRSEPVPYNNLNGLYLYNGHFQGVFSRLGPYPTICKQNGGMTAATIWVDCDNPDGVPVA